MVMLNLVETRSKNKKELKKNLAEEMTVINKNTILLLLLKKMYQWTFINHHDQVQEIKEIKGTQQETFQLKNQPLRGTEFGIKG